MIPGALEEGLGRVRAPLPWLIDVKLLSIIASCTLMLSNLSGLIYNNTFLNRVILCEKERVRFVSNFFDGFKATNLFMQYLSTAQRGQHLL